MVETIWKRSQYNVTPKVIEKSCDKIQKKFMLRVRVSRL